MSDIADAISIIVERMLAERGAKLRFKNGRTGKKFIRSFSKTERKNSGFRRGEGREKNDCSGKKSCNFVRNTITCR